MTAVSRNVLPGSHLVIWPSADTIGVIMYQELMGDHVGGRVVVWTEGGAA